MTEANHTPGPWKIHDEQYCIDEIWGNLEGPIDGKIRGTQICTLEQTDDGRVFANAKLIAAAPELLESAKLGIQWMEWWLEQEGCECEDSDFHVCGKRERHRELEAMKAAVAKATVK